MLYVKAICNMTVRDKRNINYLSSRSNHVKCYAAFFVIGKDSKKISGPPKVQKQMMVI